MGATAGKMGPDRDMYTLPKVVVIVDKGAAPQALGKVSWARCRASL